MDGYIKNKRREIAQTRKTILYSFGIPTIIAVAFILVLLLGLYVCQEPEDWRNDEIVFSNMSEVRIGRGNHNAVNSNDGKLFLIDNGLVSSDELKSRLTVGKTYSVTYSTHPINGYKTIQALADKDTVFLDLDKSITENKSYQGSLKIAILVVICIEIVAITLIDRLLCKKYHAEIKHIKEKIAQRQERMSKKQK